ncbi:hypothetical protein EDC96DRAFT_550108 [Choanephora cucurbitarum]|nr:hypothetical protein EDC96DRAFT_550108 [Choanephora cucurbitarum]
MLLLLPLRDHRLLTTVATSSDDAAVNSEVASEDTNMSSIEDVDVGEVDFSVEPMDVDANLSVTNEEIISTDPITYNWTPSEPLSIVKAAWISIMQVLDEAKTPREYQRKLINVPLFLLALG